MNLLKRTIGNDCGESRVLALRSHSARIYLILLTTLSLWGVFVALHVSQPAVALTTTPIGEIQLGANVPGVNPAEAPDRQFGDHIEPEDWRAVSLTAFIDDGSVMEMQLLRPAVGCGRLG